MDQGRARARGFATFVQSGAIVDIPLICRHFPRFFNRRFILDHRFGRLPTSSPQIAVKARSYDGCFHGHNPAPTTAR